LSFCGLFKTFCVILINYAMWNIWKKQSFNKLTFSHNSHLNFRWHFYITVLPFAVAPSSFENLWSQLLAVLQGKFVLNTVSVIRHDSYSTCQGLYLCEADWDLHIIVQYCCIEVACKCFMLSRQFKELGKYHISCLYAHRISS